MEISVSVLQSIGNLVKPHFLHIYHHFGDQSWKLWQDIEALQASGLDKSPIRAKTSSDTLRTLFRSSHWWQARTPFLIAIIFFAVLQAEASKELMIRLPIWFISYLLLSCFGSWVNDCSFDIPIRIAEAGKKKHHRRLSDRVPSWYCSLPTGILSILPWFLTMYGIVSSHLWFFNYSYYYCIPFHLFVQKTPYLSIPIDACYSYVLPVIITYLTICSKLNVSAILLTAWLPL
jgi:hypothetical protein